MLSTVALADVRCMVEPRWGDDALQTGVVLQCLNPDPIPKTLVLTLNRRHLSDGLPDQSVHVLLAGEHAVLRGLRITAPAWDLGYQVTGLMGVPRDALPHTPHRLPFLPGTKALVTQMLGSDLSSHHDATSRHAIDFGVPLGTVVVASQSGVVAGVKDGSTTSGHGPAFQGKENLVVVYHPDDTWSVYGHLEAGSVLVRPGDAVVVGQPLARTGRSGMMWGPHLHYALQMRTAQGIVSVPVPFEARAGGVVALHPSQSVTVD